MGEEEAQYPLDLLTQQQELFLTKAAAAHAQTAATSAGAAAKGTLLHAALGAILVVEVILGAYFTRELWLPLLIQATPTVEAQVVPQVKTETAIPIDTETPYPAETESATPSTPVLTPLFATESPVAESTPNAPRENPGKHLGQTPGAPNAPGQDEDKGNNKDNNNKDKKP